MLNPFLNSRFFRLCLISFSGLTPINLAFAQECRPEFQTITALFHPDPSYTVWQSFYGEPRKSEVFKSVLPAEDRGAIVAGEMRPMPEMAPSLILAEIDRRGRVKWQGHHAISGLREVIKLLPHEKGYLVAARLQSKEGREKIWLGFYDKQGQSRGANVIDAGENNIGLRDIEFDEEGGGYLIAAQLWKGGGGSGKNNGMIIKTNNQGKEILRKEYILGGRSKITSLFVSKKEDKNHSIIATGSFENDVGQEIGWIGRIEKNLTLTWGREFPRGRGAVVRDAALARDGNIIISGDILSENDTGRGAWLSKIDFYDGNQDWERYFYPKEKKHDYISKGLTLGDGGAINFAMEAVFRATPEWDKDNLSSEPIQKNEPKIIDSVPEDVNYIHVLTLSPRGVTLQGKAYYQQLGADIYQMVNAPEGGLLFAGGSRQEVSDIFDQKDKDQRDQLHVGQLPIEPTTPRPSLPQAESPETSKTGLQMLQDKIKSGQDGENVKKQADSLVEQKESAKALSVDKMVLAPVVSLQGWVFMGEDFGTYKDPCSE